MNRQIIKIVLAFILSCSIAYLIGQNVVLPLTAKNGVNAEQREAEQISEKTYDLIMDFSGLSLKGQTVTTDNPWGSNLITFEDEEHGTCLLMTPGTEISTEYMVEGQKKLHWSCNIHPWMSGISDGVQLNIEVCGVNTDVKGTTETFLITASDSFQEGEILLSPFQDTEVNVSIGVGNGNYDDSSGDWLVFDQLVIAPVEN